MLVVAHRGASLQAPEHTLEAYDLALQQGADVLEVDVRVTADGELVAIHDPTLERTTGDPRAVADVEAGEIAELDGRTRPPTLDTVLERYAQRTRLLLEIKDPEPASERRLAEAITRRELGDRVAVQCFDHEALRRLQRLAPELTVVALYRLTDDRDVVLAGLGEAASWASAVNCPLRALDGGEVVRAAARLGPAVWTYTVNDAREAERLATLGVAAIVTDAPGRIGEAVARLRSVERA
jgi:glycerophosphoryl diester phosphodiesterase